MADKRIDQLVAATTVGDDDLLVLQQNNQAKKLSGKKLGDYVYAAAAGKVAEVEQAVADAQAAIDDLESQKDTIAQAVAAMADLGTDTTLTTAGMAADAEATGNKIKNLESDYLAQMEQGTGTPGSIVTFDDAADNAPLKKLVVSIEPKQDLHGQENPYPAGGGKNKFNVDAVTNVSAGGASITNSNGTLTITIGSGSTAIQTNETLSQLADLVAGETYTLSFTSTGDSKFIYLVGASESWTSGTSKTITQGMLDGLIYFYASGVNTSCTITEIMIRPSSVSDATYAPYSNICPITGWTGANVYCTGANLWDEEWEVGGINHLTGQKYSADNLIRCKNYIPCKPNATHFFSCFKGYYMHYYDASKNYIGYDDKSANSTFTTPANAYFMRFNLAGSYGTTYNHDVSINYPSTDTAYHSYNSDSTIYPIAFPSEAGTVYGGTLENNGDDKWKLTVDRAEVNLDTLSWTYSNNKGTWPYYYFYTSVSNKAFGLSNVICSLYKTGQWATSNANFENMSVAGAALSNYIYIRNDAYSDISTFATAMSGVQLVYELATPTTYTLTSDQVRTLLNLNNVWADTGDIEELIYYKYTNASRITEDVQNAIEPMIAGVEETMTATTNYAVGDILIADHTLLEATAPIATGETITPNSNCAATTVSAQLDKLSAKIDESLTDLDGYYPGMTVGLADNLVSTTGAEDKVPYNFRTSGGAIDIGDRETETIVGGTIAWNQLVTTDTNVSKTKSGSVVSVTDAVAENAQSLIVDIAPQQNLHGYDHPWPAGGGKNLCPTPIAENVVYRNGGYMFTTAFDNGVITWTITGNASTYFMLKAFTITESHVGKTYTMSFLSTPTIELGTSSCLRLWDGTDRTTLDSRTVTITSDMVGKDLCLSFYKNGEGTYIISNVQLEEGSTATDYEPYENVCPITGFEGTVIYDDPKYAGIINWNQLIQDGNFPDNSSVWQGQQSTISISGNVAEITPTGNYGRLELKSAYRPSIASGHKYMFSVDAMKNHDKDVNVFNASLGGNTINNTIQTAQDTWEHFTRIFTATSNNTGYMYFGDSGTRYVADTGMKQYIRNLMLFDLTQIFGAGNEPSTSAEFEAMFSNTYYAYNIGEETNVGAINGETYRKVNVSFPSEAGTVYGGTLNATTGTLTVTRVKKIFDGSQNPSLFPWGNTDTYVAVLYPPFSSADQHFNYGTSSVPTDCYCNAFKPKAYGNNPKVVGDWMFYSAVTAYGPAFYFPVDTFGGDNTQSALNAYLANNPIELVYPLETPRTYTLTPQQVQMLLGANNVWSDTGSINALTYLGTTNEITALTNHKYLTKINGTATIVNGSGQVLSGEKGLDNIFNLTHMFGSSIANYVYILEQTTAGAGVSWFNHLFPKPYYSYNAGELMSVNTSTHKMVGFNLFNGTLVKGKRWVSGEFVNATNNMFAATEMKIKCIPGTKYCITLPNLQRGISVYPQIFDANGSWLRAMSYISVAAPNISATVTVPDDAYMFSFSIYSSSTLTDPELSQVNINLSWDGERDGEYAAYEEHVYPLDSSLTLRGFPKLASDNSLYYDGDIYESDGTVTRKYGIVDLGTLTWTYITATNETDRVYYAIISDKAVGFYNFVVSRDYSFTNAGTGQMHNAGYDKTIRGHNDNSRIYIRDDAYDTAALFKTGMSGVYCVYELATPTTESANPYTNPQLVDDFGTEEYIDYAVSQGTREVAVPVGHDTIYVVNLRAKLEMAPDSPDENGDYIMRKTNEGNSYVPLTEVKELPTMPTINGSYNLALTVTNGTPTLTWVMV